MNLRESFQSDFVDYKKFNGRSFEILKEKDPETYDYADVGPMYVIRLSSGERIDAYPEEIYNLNN